MNLNDFIQDVEIVGNLEAIRAYQQEKDFYDKCIEAAKKDLSFFKRVRTEVILGKETLRTRGYVVVLLAIVGFETKLDYMYEIQKDDDLKDELKDYKIESNDSINSLLNSQDFDDMIKRLTIGEIEEVSSLLQLKDEDIKILKTLMEK